MDDNIGNSVNAQGGYDNHKLEDNKSDNYSPSVSFNYGANSAGQSIKKSSSNKVPRARQQGNGGQNKRRNENKKKNVHPVNPNQTEKMIRQNDTIIKLLKEIRDRLPEPVAVEKPVAPAPKPEKKKKVVRKQRVYRFENDEAVVKESADEEVNLNVATEEVADTNVEAENQPKAEVVSDAGNIAPADETKDENLGNE